MWIKNIQILGLTLIIILLTGCSKEVVNIAESSGFSTEGVVKDDVITLNLEFLQKSEYNSRAVKKLWGMDETLPFTFFESAHSQRTLDIFSNDGKFDTPPLDFDFENYCMLITYGRKAARLECIKSEYYTESFLLISTFDEEYTGETVFFYQINKGSYVPSDLGLKCYIMNGAERVYLGSDVDSINKT